MVTQERIAEIVREVSQKDVRCAPDESLFDSGVLDSFALPDLVTALELECGIRIPDADLSPRKFESIARIERYLASKS